MSYLEIMRQNNDEFDKYYLTIQMINMVILPFGISKEELKKEIQESTKLSKQEKKELLNLIR